MTIPAGGASQPGDIRTQINFGGNHTWQSRCYQPGSEQEVLDILDRHSQGHIRAMGSKHSWSDVAACPDVSIDMSKLNHVRVYTKDGETFVRVGAGCRMQELLDRLHATSDRTLPTLGAIKRQTISGAISTGTHGSGKQSLSHFVVGIRLAAYDVTTGKPRIFEYREGDELKAARCALGCMGVILSLDLSTVAKYKVEETVVRYENLNHVLSRFQDCPLTQFVLIPYRWDYLAFERRPLENRQPSLGQRIGAMLFSLYNTVWVDVLFHIGLKGSLIAGSRAVKSLMNMAPRLLIKGVLRVDGAEQVLTLGHHYFRHEEMEMFVPEPHLQEAVDVLRCATEVFSGRNTPVHPSMETKLRALGLYDELVRNRGTYVHHYPFLFRRVLPEDTLISMAGSAQDPFYSISVFTYNKPDDRKAYYAFCLWLARCMSGLIGARLHWGKYFPLGAAETARLYPHLETFKRICGNIDPNGVFRNDFTQRVLGLPVTRQEQWC